LLAWKTPCERGGGRGRRRRDASSGGGEKGEKELKRLRRVPLLLGGCKLKGEVRDLLRGRPWRRIPLRGGSAGEFSLKLG